MGEWVRSIFNSTSLHHCLSLCFSAFSFFHWYTETEEKGRIGQNDVSIDQQSSVCRAVLNDHLRFSHFCVWHIGTQFLFPGVYPLLCTAVITLSTGYSLMHSPFMMAHSLANFCDPPTPIGTHGKCTQLCHSVVVVQFSLVPFFSISLLLFTISTKILPSEFLWEAGTCPPKSKVKEEGQTYHFSK